VWHLLNRDGSDGIRLPIARVGAIATPSQRRCESPPIRWAATAPYLLSLSLLLRLALTYLGPNGTNFIDLHVYVDGAAALGRGELYDFVYHPPVPPMPLQFTYPPFAALMFYPLHLLPFWLVGFGWLLGIAAALYGCAVVTLKFLGRPDHRVAMAWTALAIWFEPMRHVFELGQIDALLMVAVLLAGFSNRAWVSGALVGWAAGVKLTPAVAGLYFAGTRRWGALIASIAVFFVTVALSVAVLGDQARYYFTALLGDADRIGAVATAANQSLRGVVGYYLGHDGRYGPALLVLLAVTAALSVLAWRAIDSDDKLGRLLVVMVFGLLVSPISWTHHWLWVLPLVMWLIHGPLRDRTRFVGWAWIVLVLVGPPWILVFTYGQDTVASDNWAMSWAGGLYVVAALATLGYLATLRRRADRSR
jgi:alpha-1,2-mannosyltransferase